jgi:hypothetical protein
MLTGQKPFNAANPMAVIYMHRNAPLPPLPPAQARLQPLIGQLLAKLPQDRPLSAADAVWRLEAAREDWLARTPLE